jgi:hypothetical protein
MQGQALAGLRSSQTEEALAKAQETRDQIAARSRLGDSLYQMLDQQGDPHARTNSVAATDAMIAGFGDAKTAMGMIDQAQKNRAFATVTDPNADPNARLAADQGLSPGAQPFQAAEGQLIPRFAPNSQTATPQVYQTPVSTATANEKQASANLHQAQADVGGFNPHQAGVANLPPEQQAAIQRAVDEGRLNFRDINSRNANIIASLAMNNPTYNFNRAAADAALSRNATFQQRAMVVDALPGLMSHTVALGKKLNYSDAEIAGLGEKWLRGQSNDPDLTEYMSARNDVLLKLANVMRGVGMSDKAIEAENEAWHPTLSPAGLDAWLRGQMSAVGPLMEGQRRAAHIGEPGVGDQTPKPAVPTGTTPPPAGGAGPPSASASGAFTEGQTATNKATGQKLIFRGGQWQPQ